MSSRSGMTINVPLIILANLVVYFNWNWAHSAGVPAVFTDQFIATWSGLKSYHFWIYLTGIFLHRNYVHLIITTVGLLIFGSKLEDLLGGQRFFYFFLWSGASGLFWQTYMYNRYLQLPDAAAIGCQGAVAGIVMTLAFIYPLRNAKLLGFIPFWVPLAVIILFLLDCWGVALHDKDQGSPIGHGENIGGFFGAAVYYVFYLRTRIWRNVRKVTSLVARNLPNPDNKANEIPVA